MKELLITLALSLLVGCGGGQTPEAVQLTKQEDIISAFEDAGKVFDEALLFLQEDSPYVLYRRIDDGFAAYDYANGADIPLSEDTLYAPLKALFISVPIRSIIVSEETIHFEFYFEDYTAPNSVCAAVSMGGIGYGDATYEREFVELENGWYYYEERHP